MAFREAVDRILAATRAAFSREELVLLRERAEANTPADVLEARQTTARATVMAQPPRFQRQRDSATLVLITL